MKNRCTASPKIALPFVLLILLLSLVIVPNYFISISDFGRFSSLMLVAVCGLLVGVTTFWGKQKYAFSILDIFLSLFVVWQVVINLYFDKLTTLWLMELLGYCVFYLIVRRHELPFEPFAVGVVVLSLLEAVYGLMQYVGWTENYASNFFIGGTLDTPAGYGVVLVIGFVLSLYLAKESKKKITNILGAIATILLIIGIGLSQSRAAYLAVLIVVIGFTLSFATVRDWLKSHKWLFSFALLLSLCTSLVVLYFIKQDSSDGRLFIYRTTLALIQDSPFIGLGYAAFEQYYMLHQAKTLTVSTATVQLLADNVRHPLNEYLSFLLQYGLGLYLFALAYIVALWSSVKKRQEKKVNNYFPLLLTGIGTMAFFSYPFNYPFVIFISILSIANITNKWRTTKLFSIPHPITYSSFIILSSVCLYYTIQQYKANTIWHKVAQHSLEGETEKMLPFYKKLTKTLFTDPLFLYNYAAELNYAHQYVESNEIMKNCTKYLNDYDVQLLLADNYLHQKAYQQAEYHYTIASQMIPARFIPLYQLALLYQETGNTTKAQTVAQQIIDKPIKIDSYQVQHIKREMKAYLQPRMTE